MNTLLIVGGGIVLVIALLVARGVYLIGRGSDAEMAAREQSAEQLPDTLSSNGWLFIDWLQEGEIPLVSYLENRLGINQTDEEDGE